ncbi:MAG: hypothetical protein JW881_14625 [Spirochaetales bacterium]|nr:hypothetical protein [Spirochaetales bacterium]
MIESIREFIEEISFKNSEKKSFAAAAALATSELLENAVKFSKGEEIGLTIVYILSPPRNGKVMITVDNVSDSKHIKTLRSLLAEIHKNTPQQAYLRKMKEITERDFHDSTSRLGLARIHYEAMADCSLKVNRNHVSITATIVNNNI